MRQFPLMLLCAALLAMLAGCAAAPHSRFYILSPLSTDTAVHPGGSATVIGVGPVELPDYLNRPQIAVRSGPYELRYNEIRRWAEPLQDNVTGVLAENLARLVPSDRVARFPWGRTTTVAFQVVANISRFDADENGTVVLSASWKVYRGEGRENVAEKTSVIRESIGNSNDYSEIVAAQSRALDVLSREIAAAIRNAADR